MKNKKANRTSTRDKRQMLRAQALPEVRKMVSKYDLASVQAAVKVLYEERTAQKQLEFAERKVAELKSKLS